MIASDTTDLGKNETQNPTTTKQKTQTPMLFVQIFKTYQYHNFFQKMKFKKMNESLGFQPSSCAGSSAQPQLSSQNLTQRKEVLVPPVRPREPYSWLWVRLR